MRIFVGWYDEFRNNNGRFGNNSGNNRQYSVTADASTTTASDFSLTLGSSDITDNRQ